LPPDFFEKPRRTEPDTGLIILLVFAGAGAGAGFATGFGAGVGLAAATGFGKGLVDVSGIGVGVPVPGDVVSNGSTDSDVVGINRRWFGRTAKSGPRPFHEASAVTETL